MSPLKINMLKHKFQKKFDKHVTKCIVCKTNKFKTNMFSCYGCQEPIICFECKNKIKSFTCRKHK